MKAFVSSVIIFFLITITQSATAQKVCPVKFQSDAQVKVFEIADSNSADLIVYKTANSGDATSNNGVWFFAGFPDEGVKRVFFVDNATDADITVFYTSASTGAGWKNSSKTALMN